MKIDPSQNRESSVEHLLYFDTVVDMDASQNIGATLSVFEELLRRVRVALPILARNAGFDLVRIRDR